MYVCMYVCMYVKDYKGSLHMFCSEGGPTVRRLWAFHFDDDSCNFQRFYFTRVGLRVISPRDALRARALSPIHTADADETKLWRLVASASAVCT